MPTFTITFHCTEYISPCPCCPGTPRKKTITIEENTNDTKDVVKARWENINKLIDFTNLEVNSIEIN